MKIKKSQLEWHLDWKPCSWDARRVYLLVFNWNEKLYSNIVGRGFLTLLVYENSNVAQSSFSNFIQYPSTLLLLCFFGWILDHVTSNVFFSKYYRLKLVKSLSCISCNKASTLLKVWHKWHDFCWYSDLQSYTEINTNRTHRVA